MTKKLKIFFSSQNWEIIVLSLSVLVFSLFRLPSVIEPYWYGDEGIYEVIGNALRQGRVLYSEIWDNKPPLLYLIYAIFNGDQFYVRLLSLVFGVLSLVAFFLIAKQIFKKKIAVVISTFFFALLFSTPFLESNIANAENFMLFPILLAFYFLFVKKKQSVPVISSAGILISLAFLTKTVAIFDFAAFLISTLALNAVFEKKGISLTSLKNELIFITSFLVPVFITTIYFWILGVLPDFFRAVFFQNVEYVGYENNIVFPMGFLILKFSVLLLALILLFKRKEYFGNLGFIIFVWLSFSVFNAFFSARSYTHYLIVLLPSFCLFLGYIFEKKKLLYTNLVILVTVLLLIHFNFKTYNKIIPYYANYLSFISGQKEVEDYQNFFDRNTSRDYDLAQFIKYKTNAEENIFIWGDNAQLYYLSGKLPPGKYTVAYHIASVNDALEETKKALEKKLPEYIIQTKDSGEISNFLSGYELKYKVSNATIYERQY